MQIFMRSEVPGQSSGDSMGTSTHIKTSIVERIDKRIDPRIAEGSDERREECLDIGMRYQLVPASAGLGSTGDYIFLAQGDTQPLVVARQPQWWTCLRGSIEVTQEGVPPSRIAQGYTFAARRGERFGLTALEETVVVRMALDEDVAKGDGGARRRESAPQGGVERGAPAGAAFAALTAGDDAWPARLRAHGMRWAVCCVGAARLQWGGRSQGRRRIACIEPGMAFAPGARQAYSIEPLEATTGMLCFMQPRSAAQRRMYCVAPNRMSRALSSWSGLRAFASTSTPRWTAGRPAMVSNQRFRRG
jgi:hypothetical protein